MFGRIGFRSLYFKYVSAYGGMDHPGHGPGIAGMGKYAIRILREESAAAAANDARGRIPAATANPASPSMRHAGYDVAAYSQKPYVFP